MTPTLDAVMLSWRLDPWLIGPLIVTALIYTRGWLILRRRHGRWTGWRLTAFLAGLVTIVLALASPIETFSTLLLSVHMVQHLLLMMLAPPLLWLGEPLLPMLRGLPRSLRTHWIAPLFRWRSLRRVFTALTHPLLAGPLFVAVTWLWHSPPGYELALSSPTWHVVEHLCFLFTALLFWYPVIRPYPARPRWSPWLLLPYLLLADVQNTALSALLAFSGVVWYPHYATTPRLGGVSPLEDQSIAGVMMWVPGSIAFLVPLAVIGVRLFFGTNLSFRARELPPSPPSLPHSCGSFRKISLPLISDPRPRPRPWRHLRLVLQIPLLLLAVVIAWDGFRGPPASPMNLAGVLPWIHWRGLLALSLVLFGNLACMGCPLVLPRRLLQRWLPLGRAWPRWLRGKWLAVILLLLFLWAYEAFALWDSPWLAAWLIVGYFVTAFVIDTLFQPGSFCKYVCPIGQFNFVGSLVSPSEVRVKDPRVCHTCVTKDCIRGNDRGPGCETHLFVPRKHGNLDCTFCLDCVHACPKDNISIAATTPGSDLWRDPQRSGVGRFSRRTDLAVLVIVLVFGAFANAGAMVSPVVDFQDQFGPMLGLTSRLAQTITYLILTLILTPLVLMGAAAWVSRTDSLIGTATRYAFALVPLGVAMWLAHYSFHLFTSWESILPVMQRFALDLGVTWFGEPRWACCCCAETPLWLLRLEIVMLDVGLLLSLYTAFRIARRSASPRRALLSALPWGVVMLILFAVGVWIVLQPMQMRGTLT
jgi:cytochrome c oxidase assembly factor CtaG